MTAMTDTGTGDARNAEASAGRIADNIVHFARTLRRAGMPVGPLSLNDEVAIDLSLKIIRAAIADMGEKAVDPRHLELVERMVEKDGRTPELHEHIAQALPGATWARVQNNPLAIDGLIPKIAHEMYPALFLICLQCLITEKHLDQGRIKHSKATTQQQTDLCEATLLVIHCLISKL